MSEYKYSQFGTLKTTIELEEYMQRAYTHSGYYHYTTLNNINSILESKEFWLSSVTRFNDTVDTSAFGEDADLFFSLSFSTGVNENMPLWYLYSGTDGKGGRIRVPKSQICKLVREGRYYLSTNTTSICLKELNDTNSELMFKDVIYYKERIGTNPCVDLKYNNLTNYSQISLDDFNLYKEKNKGFCKYIIWYYEKETRLVIKLKGDAKEYVENNKLGKDENYVVKLSYEMIPKLKQSIKIDLAPEVTDIHRSIEGMDAIKSHIIETSNISKSMYSGQINMRLNRRK